ncbi:MAG: hypothetical protein ACKOFD_05285 [Actinomycetota bacterium]
MPNTMMDYFSPTDGTDVARRSDIDHLAAMMTARFDQLDARVNQLDRKLMRFGNSLAALLGISIGMVMNMIMLIVLLP